MAKKIVFFDLDGTILNDEKNIADSVKKAISALQRKGILTAIATGRTPEMFGEIRKEAMIHSFVSMNGQYTVLEGKEIHANPIEEKRIERLLMATDSRGDALAYCGNERIRTNQESHPFILSSFQTLRMEPPACEKDFYLHAPVYQGHLYCSEESRAFYENEFPEFDFVPWHPYAADILPKGASKAIGVQKMIQAADILRENSYAFGDGLNDIEMLRFVGTGIAMGNAVPEAKQAADWITDTNGNDGIVKGLIQAGLLEEKDLETCGEKNCCQKCAQRKRLESLQSVHFI